MWTPGEIRRACLGEEKERPGSVTPWVGGGQASACRRRAGGGILSWKSRISRKR